jgi:hypothetical protein
MRIETHDILRVVEQFGERFDDIICDDCLPPNSVTCVQGQKVSVSEENVTDTDLMRSFWGAFEALTLDSSGQQ